MPLDEITTDGFRLAVSSFDCCGDDDRLKARRRKRRDVLLGRAHVLVELRRTRGVELQRLVGHRAIDVDRQHRNPALLLETPHPVEHLLDAADGKRRNDQLAAALDRAADHLRQLLAVVVRDVIAIAVGGLHQHDIGLHRV